jgi:predicted CXXCH cytochrome family protein
MRPPPAALLCLILALGPGCPSGRDTATTPGSRAVAAAPTSAGGAQAAGGSPGEVRSATDRRATAGRLAPIAAAEARSTHGPFSSGACETCHERHDAANPGRAVSASNQVCVGCHEEFGVGTPVHLDRSVHPVNDAPCTGCHNPHNARKPKLQM